VRVIRVRAIAERRGGFEAALLLYEEEAQAGAERPAPSA
jgi:hypothetical protein